MKYTKITRRKEYFRFCKYTGNEGKRRTDGTQQTESVKIVYTHSVLRHQFLFGEAGNILHIRVPIQTIDL